MKTVYLSAVGRHRFPSSTAVESEHDCSIYGELADSGCCHYFNNATYRLAHAHLADEVTLKKPFDYWSGQKLIGSKCRRIKSCTLCQHIFFLQIFHLVRFSLWILNCVFIFGFDLCKIKILSKQTQLIAVNDHECLLISIILLL